MYVLLQFKIRHYYHYFFNLSFVQTSKLLEEKDEHIETLQERVRTLEQRISDSNLSGDDRLAALEAERTKLEEKLAEARQQLTEVKVTWSDKITQLEQQVKREGRALSIVCLKPLKCQLRNSS